MAKNRKLTPDEDRFVDEFLIDRNGTAAYIRANPGTPPRTASRQASKLRAKAYIKAAIREGISGQRRRSKLKADTVIREMMRLATYDVGAAFDLSKSHPALLAPRDIPYDVRKAITAIKLKKRRLAGGDDEVYEIEEWEYKFADKLSALDKLMRHLDLYKELPPLEVLIGSLPAGIAEAVRTAIAASVHGSRDPQPVPADGGGTGDTPPAAAGSDAPDEVLGAESGPVAGEPDPTAGTADGDPVHPPGGEDTCGGDEGYSPLLLD